MRCKYKHLKSIINHSFQKKIYPLNVKIAYTYNKSFLLFLQKNVLHKHRNDCFTSYYRIKIAFLLENQAPQ